MQGFILVGGLITLLVFFVLEIVLYALDPRTSVNQSGFMRVVSWKEPAPDSVQRRNAVTRGAKGRGNRRTLQGIASARRRFRSKTRSLRARGLAARHSTLMSGAWVE